MAVNKKWSRRIVVDGVAYLWRFPHRMTDSQDDGWPGVAVTISREDCRHAVLFLAFPNRFHMSGPLAQEAPRPVLPSDVARGIKAALLAGWQATEPGPRFELSVREDDASELGAATEHPLSR